MQHLEILSKNRLKSLTQDVNFQAVMKCIRPMLFISLFILISKAYSQPRKAPSVVKTPSVSGTVIDNGPLNPEDYKYYVLIQRVGEDKTNDPNLLKSKAPTTGNLSFRYIIMDIRTGKELMWWPEMDTFIKDGCIYGYINQSTGSVISKFTSTGKYVFSKFLTWKTPTGQESMSYKSADNKQVYSIFNNDAWIGDLDLASGQVNNMHQVTQNGLMTSFDNSYLRGSILLMSNYIINTKDGNYQQAGAPINILTDTCPWFATGQHYNPDVAPTIWSFEDGKKLASIPQSNGVGFLCWVNRQQTKLLFQTKSTEGKILRYIYEPGEKSGDNTKKYKRVTWQNYPSAGNELWNAELEFGMSPNSKYMISEKDELSNVVLNLETLEEFTVPFSTGEMPPQSERVWADDTHYIFSLRAGRMRPDILNGQQITTATQGTYVLDVETRQIKRLTPYFIKEYRTDFVPLFGAKSVLFTANNYVFKCNSDGSELTQLTKIPGTYGLAGAFIK